MVLEMFKKWSFACSEYYNYFYLC